MYTYNEQMQKVPIQARENFVVAPTKQIRENYGHGSSKSNLVWIIAGIVGLLLLLLAIYMLFFKKKPVTMGFRKQRFGFTFY
jgi:LPXTG-motif cell wall-anchored protein